MNCKALWSISGVRFCSPLNSIPDIPGIISVVTAGIILVAGIISAVIGGHFGGGAVLFR